MFSGGNNAPSSPFKSQSAAAISSSSTGPPLNVYVSEIPVIEQISLISSTNSIEDVTTEEEVVEEIDLESLPLSALVDANSAPSHIAKTPLPDLSRQSVSLDGDSIIALSSLPPPPSLSRFSFYHSPGYGSNRLSNMPVQINADIDAEKAQFDDMMARFESAKKLASLHSASSGDSFSPRPLPSTTHGSTPSRNNASLQTLKKDDKSISSEIPSSSTPTASSVPEEVVKVVQIDSPSLVMSTYTHGSATKRLQTVKRLFPVRLATTQSAIGSPRPESVLCFKKTCEAIARHVEATGRRNLDFIVSAVAVGPFLRQDRTFEVVLLPAGPELIRADIEASRWRTVCDVSTTPATLMHAILLIHPSGSGNYILRLCGTTEYLVVNERPLIDYARLRLLIRDRTRIVLLCEDRCGARISESLSHHERALCASPVPTTTIGPYYGLATYERESADVGHLEGQLSLKVHALEHLKADILKEYLDLNDANFASFKSAFESSGLLPSDMSFAVEFALVYNNEILEGEQRTSWKPSPMWVEQVKFEQNWSQLPRELRVLIRILFRKSKSSRPFTIGEVCIHLFDAFGVLVTGKQAVAIRPSTFSGKHSFTTSTPVNSVYKSKSVPFLHYEIFELKSGLMLLHDQSPVLPSSSKRSHASPIEFLLPERSEEAELSRLVRVHPLYRLNDSEKSMVWKFRYSLHFSSQHSLPLLVKCVDWMNPKMVEEMHRLITQWELLDPLLALELLDADVSDTVSRTFAVDCLHQFSDEELVMYMLQLTQALVLFENHHDSSLARFLLERSLRNRTLVGNAFYWNLISIEGDGNVLERIAVLTECYLLASGEEHSARFASQLRVLQHFRTLSSKASKLEPKAKLALLENELQPDLFLLTGEEEGAVPTTNISTSPRAALTHHYALSTSPSPSSPKGNSTTTQMAKARQTTTQQTAINITTQKNATLASSADYSAISSSVPNQTSHMQQLPLSKTPAPETMQTKGRTWTFSKLSPAAGSIKSSSTTSSGTKPISVVSSSYAPTSTSTSSTELEISSSGFSPYSSRSFAFLNLPLDPSMCTRRIIKSKCKFMVSSAAPMWLVFDNADPLASPAPAIFKCGDDLRQDILILQMLNLMDEIWQRDGLELHVSAYACVATGRGEGFIEVIQNSTTTGKIQKSFGASGALRKTPLASWLQQQHSGNPALHEEAIDNFVSSCAAYCVASYVLGLGDRHADNIMVTTMGNLFHIDFAHILGNIMMFGAYKRERAPFVLTPEFVFVMGDTKSKRYARFVDLCLKGYNSLRRHTYLLIRLFKMMLSAGLPQFTDQGELAYLYKSLSLGISEKSAAEKFSKLIDESRKTTTTLVNNFFHNLATGAVGAATASITTAASSSSLLSSSSSTRATTSSNTSTINFTNTVATASSNTATSTMASSSSSSSSPQHSNLATSPRKIGNAKSAISLSGSKKESGNEPSPAKSKKLKR